MDVKMKRRAIFALLLLLVLIQLGRSDIRDEKDTGKTGLSKRSVLTARQTVEKLRSSFFTLARGNSNEKSLRTPKNLYAFGGIPFYSGGNSRPTDTSKTGLFKPTFFRAWKSFQKSYPDTSKTELSKSTFLTARKTFQKSRPTGSSKLDIVFVLDKSGSIRPSNFDLEKKFVQKLIEFFPILPAKTRVAVVTYSTRVKLEFNFNKHINKTCLRNGIQKIRYTGGWTSTGSALEYVKNNLLFSRAAGARSEATKVIYLLTDGKSNRGIKPGIPSGQLKQRQVIIYAMGVTMHIRESELQQIASSKPEDHVFHIMNYAVLNEVIRLLQGDEPIIQENVLKDLPKKKSIQDTTVFARRRTG